MRDNDRKTFVCAVLPKGKGCRTGWTGGDTEAAAEASGLVVPEFAVVEVAGLENASVNASPTLYTLFWVLVGGELG